MNKQNDSWRKVKLKIVTPLRVGSGERYPTATLANVSGEWYRLSMKGFFIHSYSKNIYFDGPVKIPENAIQRDHYLYKINPKISDIESFKEVQAMIHHPLGGVYIPGSSIKGVLRLAMSQLIVLESKEKIRDCVESDIQSKRKKFEKTNNFINEQFRGGNLKDMNSDIFRFLLVSDTNVVNVPTEIWRTKVLKLFDNKIIDKNSDFLVETIPAGTEFEFYIKINTQDLNNLINFEKTKYSQALLQNFTLEKIFEQLNKYYDKAIKDEQDRMLPLAKQNPYVNSIIKFYEEIKKEPYKIRIADGGGLMFTSLFPWLSKDKRVAIRNIIKFHGQDPAPLSRNYIAKGTNQISELIQMGWCKVEIE
ncbi:MAG: type III-A CRISPR-associated RAMP protein Csm5 [Thermoplasmata archaeon]